MRRTTPPDLATHSAPIARALAAVALAALLAATAPGGARAGSLGFEDLLRPMVDLRALAVSPEEGEYCRQFSSYDRATRWDPDTGQIVGNEANHDWGHFLRQEPAGAVLAEMDGPGVIYRIWSANAAGTIKIFIDGEAEPRLSVPMQDLLGGKIQPLTEPLAGVRARGWNLYLPIAYQKACKVVVEDPGPMYYQVTYRTFPAGTEVEPFRWPLAAEQVQAIQKVKGILANPGSHLEGESPQLDESFWLGAGQGESAELQGPLALTGIELELTGLPDDPKELRSLLRRAVITARWDDEEDAVRAPLGDFFGTAPGLNPYPGFPTGIDKDRKLYAYWYMPFKRSATLRLENLGERSFSGRARLFAEPLAVPQEKLLYFRADWRYEDSVARFDWPLLISKGKGRFCGTALHVFNSRTGWWGEGDEKMWIDGEDFPSTIGTGSEDYFGYAWCSNELFFNPYHNQSLCEGPGNGNYSSVNRFQIPDNVPFHRSATITIEAYNRKTVTYAATTYWYGSPGATTDAKPVDLAAIKWPEGFKPFVIPGAIEGESLKVLSKEPDYPIGAQDISGFGEFSRSSQVWLRPGAAGAKAEFLVPEKVRPGKYQLTLWVVRSWDYGIVQWSLNGKPVTDRIDGYSKEVVAKEVDCGVVEIVPGRNVLSVEIPARSESSTGFYAGLDALRLSPVN